MILNSNQIQEIIPHRYPFLLVDKIINLSPGRSAVGLKNVSVNDYFFMGHFPSEHIMPGVLIIESLAQVGAVSILSCENNKGKMVYFAGIKKAKFRKKVIPGDTLYLYTNLLNIKGKIGICDCIAKVDETIVCECQIMFAIGN